MKKTRILLAFAVVLFAAAPGIVPVRAQNIPTPVPVPCTNAAGINCKALPEPSSLSMLATGLIAVGALVLFGRKKFARNKA
jgi:hypothetical protein